MIGRKLLGAAIVAIAAVFVSTSESARGDDWGRYYHWPYNNFHQYQWSPYEYQKTYDGGFRYPEQMRVNPTEFGSRNWSTVRKPFYRGNHFILDRF